MSPLGSPPAASAGVDVTGHTAERAFAPRDLRRVVPIVGQAVAIVAGPTGARGVERQRRGLAGEHQDDSAQPANITSIVAIPALSKFDIHPLE